MSATPTITDMWSDGKRLHVIGTIAFAGSYVAGGDVLDLGTAGVRCSKAPNYINFNQLRQFELGYHPAPLSVAGGKLVVYLKSAQAATGTITSNGTNVSDADTVTIGANTYTFKNTPTTAAGQVQIGASATKSMQNLIDAINNNTDNSGITYGALTIANPTEFAPSIADGGLIVTVIARKGGVGGNSDALSKVAATLSVSAANLANGAAVSVNPGELASGAYPADILTYNAPFYAIYDQYI